MHHSEQTAEGASVDASSSSIAQAAHSSYGATNAQLSVPVPRARENPRELSPRTGRRSAIQHSAVREESSTEKAYSESVAGFPLVVQFLVYGLALIVLGLVLILPSFLHEHHHDHHADTGSHNVMRNIAYCSLSAGTIAFIMYMLRQPPLLGYLLAGVLVGPIGLRIIVDEDEISTISELGLIFLLFMIGLELNVFELIEHGKEVVIAGVLQFPICVAAHLPICLALGAAGLPLGSGQFAGTYIAVCCGMSSTMVVVTLLQSKRDTKTQPGRITVGILIFQDLWAIIALAIQPNITDPKVSHMMQTAGLMLGLVLLAFLYAKYVMPPVFKSAQETTEMMLVLSLAWCFFVCCVAMLPFVNLSMEVAALIAGVSMATFPYSVELNSKIKHIRDFFVTLYFVGLGMQIPVPSLLMVSTSLLLVVIVLAVRWMGIFLVLYMAGAGGRAATLATINLSNISEFGLVICSLGHGYGHVGKETLTILIWTFSLLAILASYLISSNDLIFSFLNGRLGQATPRGTEDKEDKEDIERAGHRDVVFLGCYTLGRTLINMLRKKSPDFLERVHVIDVSIAQAGDLRKFGIEYTYGDISSSDVLKEAQTCPARIVLSTIPDSVLRGTTNLRLLQMSRAIWPDCQFIGLAETDAEVNELYESGATFVLMPFRQGAERLAEILCNACRFAKFERQHSLDLQPTLESLATSDNPALQRLPPMSPGLRA